MTRPRSRFKPLTINQAQDILRLTLASVSAREVAIALRIPYNQVVKELSRINLTLKLFGIQPDKHFSTGEYILYLEKYIHLIQSTKYKQASPGAKEMFLNPCEFVPKEYDHILNELYNKNNEAAEV
jgi:hypothetical protein